MSADEVMFLCNRAISLAEDHCLDEARSILAQAEGSQGDDPRLEGVVEAARCRFFDLSGDQRRAAKHGRVAIRLLQSHGSADETAAAVIYLGSVRTRQGRYLEGLNLYNKAITLVRGSADLRLLVLARWGLGSALGFLERYEESRESLAAAEARSRDLLTLAERGRLQKNLGLACLYCGDYERAQALLSTALRAFETTGRVDLISDCHNCIGSLRMATGDRDAARDSYCRAIDILNDQPLPQLAEAYYELAYYELSGLGIAHGNAAKAAEHALTALKVARRLNSDLEAGRSMLALGQAFMGLEKYEAAVPYLQRASTTLRRKGFKLSVIVAEDMLRQAERWSQSCRSSFSSRTQH